MEPRRRLLLLALVSSTALAFLRGAAAGERETIPAPPSESRGAAAESPTLKRLEAAVMDIASRSNPSIVFLGGGSGVCIAADGLLLTNDHVVGNARTMVARFALSGVRRKANLLGRFPDGDIALLKIDEPGPYPHLELGDSEALVPGERVLALGNPFLLAKDNSFFPGVPANYEPSVSLGVVSAVHRYSPPRYPDAIQVDVAVNPGNSGGPLVNLGGQVVGINGKIETRLHISVNSGVGYAIPSNLIRRFIEPLRNAGGAVIQHGRIQGVEVEDRSSADRPGLGVKRVLAGSPAETAGLLAGDRILRIDDIPVPTRPRFEGLFQTFPIGSQVKVQVLRGGEEKQVLVTLVNPERKGQVRLGVKFDLDAQTESRLVVSSVNDGSPAAKAGLQKGDAIVEFDGEAVKNFFELKSRLEKKKPGDVATVKVKRGEMDLELKIFLAADPSD
jgi:serine protease Do